MLTLPRCPYQPPPLPLLRTLLLLLSLPQPKDTHIWATNRCFPDTHIIHMKLVNTPLFQITIQKGSEGKFINQLEYMISIIA